MTESKFTKKMRENPYFTATISLLICVIAMILFNMYSADEQVNGWKDDVCSDMVRYQIGTPSWFDNNGSLVYSGYIPMENFTREKFEEVLIDNRIHLVYREGCGWCEKQIEEIKVLDTWEIYERKGLTIKCS